MFQRRVYEGVVKIPKGRVVTYGQLARMLGKPTCARAVGNALNKNIFSDVPCHRVVRADGLVGGYAWGTPEKIKILRLEGVHIKNGRVNFTYLIPPLK